MKSIIKEFVLTIFLIGFLIGLLYVLMLGNYNAYMKDYNETPTGETLYAVDSYSLTNDGYRVTCENGNIYTVRTVQIDSDCDGVYIHIEKRLQPLNFWQVNAHAFSMSSRRYIVYNITLVTGGLL